MGWSDREYMRDSAPARSWAALGDAPASLALLTAHAAALLFVSMMRFDAGQAAADAMRLSAETATPAAILTHAWATNSFWTTVFVCWLIWVLGRPIESRIGGARLVLWYFAANLLAGAAYFAIAILRPAWATYPLTVPLGAAVAAIVWGWTQLPGEMTAIFGAAWPTARLAAVLGGISALWIAMSGGGGAAAWFGGGAVAGLGAQVLVSLPRRGARRRAEPARRERASKTRELDDIDDILAKISREGLASLTPRERRRLEAARQARLRRTN
ncbi:MAG: rhomboid family intramembrane serine protease [Phycisphaerae bacterium]